MYSFLASSIKFYPDFYLETYLTGLLSLLTILRDIALSSHVAACFLFILNFIATSSNVIGCFNNSIIDGITISNKSLDASFVGVFSFTI